MNLKANEIRNMSTDELIKKTNDAREELMNLRFRLSTGELTDYTQIRHTRRTIARLTTVLNQRMRMAAMEGEE